MSEELTSYLEEHGVKVAYLHSDIETLDRQDFSLIHASEKLMLLSGLIFFVKDLTCRKFLCCDT